MKSILKLMLTAGLVLGILPAGSALADQYADTLAIFKQSPVVRTFFDNCYGYAVFPTVGKGGFVVGGAYGTGLVYAGDKVTGTAKLIKATFGLQAGGQAFSQILFFQDQRAYRDFTQREFRTRCGCVGRGHHCRGAGQSRDQWFHRGDKRGAGHRYPGRDHLLQRHGRLRPRQGRTDVRSHRGRTKIYVHTTGKMSLCVGDVAPIGTTDNRRDP